MELLAVDVTAASYGCVSHVGTMSTAWLLLVLVVLATLLIRLNGGNMRHIWSVSYYYERRKGLPLVLPLVLQIVWNMVECNDHSRWSWN